MKQKLKLIITGSTGMVGEGVLLECLENPLVEKILVVNRHECGYSHPKLKEIIHSDFFDLSAIENELSGYNACFFCLGVSSIGMNEEDYTKMTYTLTLNFANTLIKHNSDLSFSYISGKATDSKEKGKSMWARVKGKTENDLQKMKFKDSYAFRPGMLKPTKGQKYVLKYYKYVGWLFPIINVLIPSWACSIKQLAKAMIVATYHRSILDTFEVKDIKRLATVKD
ncbi:MAG: epimerase [Bacteroidia bacterium]